MKRVIITSFFIFIYFLAFSQMRARTRYAFTLDVAPRGGFGNSFFYNDNVHYDKEVQRDIFGPAYFYGGKIGLSYISSRPRFIFFTVYGEYTTGFYKEVYKLKNFVDDNSFYKKELNFNTNDYTFMFRLTGFAGKNHDTPRYIEIGLQQSFLHSVDEKNTLEDPLFFVSNPSYEPRNNYNPVYKNLVFGFGIHKTFFHWGLRGTYSIDNIMLEEKNPVLDGFYNMNNPGYPESYSSYKPTRLFTLQLVLEINLYFLEIGTASCGKLAVKPFPFFLNNDFIWKY